MLEIIAVVVIIGILATLAIPTFQNVIESSQDEVCATNLQTLQKAVDIYVIERGTVPGSLSELRPRHIDAAYALVMQGRGAWKKRLAQWITDANERGFAFAQAGTFPQLRCPKDLNGGVSYGLNSDVAGLTAQEYKNAQATTLIVVDADTTVVDVGFFGIDVAEIQPLDRFAFVEYAYAHHGNCSGHHMQRGSGHHRRNDLEVSSVPSALATLLPVRGHVQYRPFAQPQRFFQGITKDGTIVILTGS